MGLLGGMKTMLAAAAGVLMLAGAAMAETRIQGGGASFPAPLYAKWVSAFNAKFTDYKVDYQGSGSGAGIKGITDRTFVFAGSDAPLTADQEKKTPAKLLHIPSVAGPVVMVYNLPELDGKELILSGDVVAGIYLKEITNWNDGKIAALNAGLALPNRPIVVAHRSDGSGTTFVFTNYLAKVSKKWSDDVGNATTVEWPTGLGGPGNKGVAQIVQNTAGAVGYVEFAYALDPSNKLVYATMRNKAGKNVKPSITGVEAAAASALKELPADLKVSITDADSDDSYPISGFTYMLIYQDLSYLKDKALAEGIVKYFDWCMGEGQDMAKDLGYAKLPKDVAEKVHAKLKTITFDGQPLLK